MATEPTNDPWEPVTRPDVLWDGEAHGRCIRVYSDGSKSYIFVYRIGDRQRYIRIGSSNEWSLKAARNRAKELRTATCCLVLGTAISRCDEAGRNVQHASRPCTVFRLEQRSFACIVAPTGWVRQRAIVANGRQLYMDVHAA